MILSIVSEPNSVLADQGSAVATEPFWNEGAILIATVGLSILVVWLFWFGGFGALRRSPVRRNRLSALVPMAILGVWLLLMVGINWGIEAVFGDTSASFQEAISYPAMVVLELLLIVVMGVIAKAVFARRLKGFGLNFRTIFKDAGFGFVNLAAVYSLVIVLLWAVLCVGKSFNPDFSLQEHQSLTFLGEAESLWFQVVTAVFAVLIVPVFEEMLFRGLFQTSIRSAIGCPWPAIVITSLFFSILHPLTHAPALFALSCGLGYAYERSGSLLRPILMHIMFNGLSVLGTFLSS